MKIQVISKIRKKKHGGNLTELIPRINTTKFISLPPKNRIRIDLLMAGSSLINRLYAGKLDYRQEKFTSGLAA